VTRVTPEYIESGRAHSLQDHPIPPGVALYRIHGPFLFGSTDKLLTITDEIDQLPPVVVLRMRNTTAMDATGLSAIADLADALRLSGRTLILCGAPAQPAALLRRAEFEQHLGAGNICASVEEALRRASEILDAAPVQTPVTVGTD
jgi:SulP family sulfate permease